MKIKNSVLLILSACVLNACSAIKSPVVHQYALTAFSAKPSARTAHISILVTPPEAVSGYQTEQMVYTSQLFAKRNFAKNSWSSPPASMLYPLLIQSLQQSHYFYAVGAGVYLSKTTYRLDTQLLKIEQNFIKKPSVLAFEVKAILARVEDNQIIASHTFKQLIPCPQDSPYGGVIAANIATQNLTKNITAFAIKHAVES